MTPEEFEKEMEKIYLRLEKEGNDLGGYDEEPAHLDADELMCTVLIEEGYQKGVNIFKKIGKWHS